MCQPYRSCNVNEDTGLNLAFTLAHEIGHNFGMPHDTEENGCLPSPSSSSLMSVMSSKLNLRTSPFIWSECSRRSITAFLDNNNNNNNNNDNNNNNNNNNNKDDFVDEVEGALHLLPGFMYDVHQQCRLQFGNRADRCQNLTDDICRTLWCQLGDHCFTKMEPAAEGTLYTHMIVITQWCLKSKCTEITELTPPRHGEWGSWGQWSSCSRSCEVGVQVRVRACDNPEPLHGGKYCTGDRKQYKICNIHHCPSSSSSSSSSPPASLLSMRLDQCSSFNKVPYKERFYQWVPVYYSGGKNPCQLHCRPAGQYFSVMLSDKVLDGTLCTMSGRDICVGGDCKAVGCDWRLDSNKTDDACGVCGGDSSGCRTVVERLDIAANNTSYLGYVDVGRVPLGASHIFIKIKYTLIKCNRYWLNGNWHIQWPSQYEVFGTVMKYERRRNKETLDIPGPVNQTFYIAVIYQSANRPITVRYTLPNPGPPNQRRPNLIWQHLDWSPCTATCGNGL
ncbi:hypothetical protein HELRODRAFT_89720 [Helobdella robusta]|uniref:Peptidase M12B domain-containing protein n=1 Tax=Helobdella robusta TaxID=6412 RepID=T1G7G5_HELRO|nr:hypothetical protein HELRODRAFT_89720 [Helobdella robusta]ESN92243.1 hypothetical protein HELRODRAFT_89720 [Helobdella robusta]